MSEEGELEILDDRPPIDWSKISSLLSSNTSNALQELLTEREAMNKPKEVTEVNEDNETREITQQKVKFGKHPPNSVFKLQEYWEERFEEEENYEWLVNWSKVKDIIKPYLTPSSRILIVGCGNSSFSADIYDEGFENITNIDFSSVVIQKMSAVHSEKRPNMKWIEMDMTKLQFPENSFDIVLDKAAMDALVVDEGDVWNPKEEVITSVDAMCQCVGKVLTSDGILLQISFAQPHFRTKYLMGYRASHEECSPYESHKGYSKRYGWELNYCEVPSIETGCLAVFMYDMKKRKE